MPDLRWAELRFTTSKKNWPKKVPDAPTEAQPEWQELWLLVGATEAEPWSEALLAAGALSVHAEDADADSPDEQPLYGEPGILTPGQMHGWQRTRLSALFDAETNVMALLTEVATERNSPLPTVVEQRRVRDEDWVQRTQSQFEPIAIGARLWITPSWLPPADPERVTVILDPGVAFGTGSHPTTRLCLQWLERHLQPGTRLIDYGCGSGILAIAAARLGAHPVIGIDIDPQALSATLANAQRNQVTVQVLSPSDPKPAPASVVMANILSNPLKLLAPMLIDLVELGGTLVLSGVLERQVEDVCAVYAAKLPLRMVQSSDGWACLVGTRPG
jgi:ribosomal protein L11 methyltransferase